MVENYKYSRVAKEKMLYISTEKIFKSKNDQSLVKNAYLFFRKYTKRTIRENYLRSAPKCKKELLESYLIWQLYI